jgi:molybdopterin molybdotransferase
MPPLPTTSFATPDEALVALMAPLRPVATEELPWQEAAGRVLAQPIVADRDSPPCDNSAMDGFAVRLADVCREGMTVAGEVLIGQRPSPLPAGQALRIVTGAPLPAGADTVIRCEDVEQCESTIAVRPDVELTRGDYVRHQGENIKQTKQFSTPGGYSTRPSCRRLPRSAWRGFACIVASASASWSPATRSDPRSRP